MTPDRRRRLPADDGRGRGLIEVMAAPVAAWQVGAWPVSSASARCGWNRTRGETPMFKHVLIPTDGSPISEEAVTRGIAFAAALGARATAMVVIEPFHLLTANVAQIESTRASYEAHAAKHAEDILAAAAAKAAAAGVQLTTRTVLHDQPFDAIIRTAQEEGCDVITMASHGRRGMAALVLGSQTTKVLTHSKIPVLVLR
jgi:nucleotide-binding universal stress UspA family protein